MSKSFRVGLPWELLYADDLVLIAESEEQLSDMLKHVKDGMESKDLKSKHRQGRCMQERSGEKFFALHYMQEMDS